MIMIADIPRCKLLAVLFIRVIISCRRQSSDEIVQIQKTLLIIGLLFAVFSCEKDAFLDTAIQEVIRNEIMRFSHSTTPIALQELFDSSNILLFGETHYVQEHQDFMVSQFNSRFSTTDIKISYNSGTTVIAPIDEQFDAIITHPEIATLQSMAIYERRVELHSTLL